MNILETLKECFAENGIVINNMDEELELDSIQYISLIVTIEQKFEMEYPEELLGEKAILTFNKLYEDVKRINEIGVNQ